MLRPDSCNSLIRSLSIEIKSMGDEILSLFELTDPSPADTERLYFLLESISDKERTLKTFGVEVVYAS